MTEPRKSIRPTGKENTKKALSPGERVELTVSALGSEGQGIARSDGLAVFVPGALPGERVAARIKKVNKAYAQAELEAVLESAPSRREPVCGHFPCCGGCDLLHLDYQAQLRFKREKVKNALERIGGFRGIEVDACIGADEQFGYRNKSVFSFENREGIVVSGNLAERSHSVVRIDACPIASEAANAALSATTRFLNEQGLTAFSRKTGTGLVKSLVVRTNSRAEAMVVLVTARPFEKREELVRCLRGAVPGLVSVMLNLNPGKNTPIMGEKNETLFGSDELCENILGLDFFVGAQSFLQVNHAQCERLYAAALDALDPMREDTAVDLYCGIGTLSLLIAKRAGSVIGIEYAPSAIRDAKNNARKNGMDNVELFCGAAEKLLPELVCGSSSAGKKPMQAQGQLRAGRITKLLLDPPRAGADAAVLNAIAEAKIPRVVYVSCDPATLARDCRLLVDQGYSVKRAIPVDMFPNSAHVECVTLMTKK